MPEFGGLQIEVRCVSCGRLPTANVTLYEMQNHSFICNVCRQDAERRGRQIAWVQGAQMETMISATPSSSLALPTAPTRTRALPGNLPPDSLFAKLELPLDTPTSTIRETIKQQMMLWMKKPDSAEKKAMIARLREWREDIQDELAFETYRDNMRSLSRREGSALTVGSQMVFTAQEFLAACEATQEGWADGERYLRTGQLRQWILFQLEERDLATEAYRYQTWTSVPNFRALNEMLYCLIPERPFQLYSHERWQKLDTIPSAETPKELTTLCDIHWSSAEGHLYEGSMIFWLERSRGIQGLRAYYDAKIADYANQWEERGVGLELLLEHAVPDLAEPAIVVDCDGNVVDFQDNKGTYTLKRWDREIRHKPVTVTVTNTTRGFVSLTLALQPREYQAEPDWMDMNENQPVAVRGRPGAGFPASKTLRLDNLEQMRRGSTYQRKLFIGRRGENGQLAEEELSIKLQTMWFFDGLRGKLWTWGLRGGMVGLLWNFAAGTLLALFFFLLVPAVVSQTYLDWGTQLNSQLSSGIVLEAIATGFVDALQFAQFIPHHPIAFPFIVGAVLGFVGFWVGLGKGHMDYTERRNAVGFRKGAFLLSALYVPLLLYFDGGFITIPVGFQALGRYSTSYSSGASIYVNYQIVTAIQYMVGGILAGCLIFLLACILASIRYRLEKYVRNRYQALLDPPGRQ